MQYSKPHHRNTKHKYQNLQLGTITNSSTHHTTAKLQHTSSQTNKTTIGMVRSKLKNKTRHSQKYKLTTGQLDNQKQIKRNYRHSQKHSMKAGAKLGSCDYTNAGGKHVYVLASRYMFLQAGACSCKQVHGLISRCMIKQSSNML